jgi:hypothetical protein
MIALFFAQALALTGDDIVSRMADVAPLRAQRLAGGLPDVTDDVYRKIADGSVHTFLQEVPGFRAKQAFGVGIVNVHISKLWSAVNDDAGKARVTQLSFAEVQHGEPCGVDRKTFQYLPISLLTDRWWVVHQRANVPLQVVTQGAVREAHWESVEDQQALLVTDAAKAKAAEGMAVPFTKGAWFLVDLGDSQTLVEYYTWADPGGMVPARMASNFAAGGIDDLFRHVEELANDGPACPIN